MSNMVTVEFHENGRPIKMDVLAQKGMGRLKEMVVIGKVKKDSANNITIVASGLFLRP
ncbi:MAG: hypothetical protein V3W41_16620 [Planctomycetota bacterium]